MRAFFSNLMSWFDDRLNPVAVKELRQAVQSRLVVSTLSLLLVLQIGCLAVYLIIVGVEEQSRSLSFGGGRVIFTILQGILLFICMLLIPGFAGFRLASERSDTNVDLLFITGLSPLGIVKGKLTAATVLVLLIFSACAPFMMFTYLLRGVDVFSMIVILIIDFLAVLGGIQFALFYASITAPRGLKSLLGLLCAGQLFTIFYLTVAGTSILMIEGDLNRVESSYFWGIALSILIGFVSSMGLFFVWSVALLSPPSSNRALPVRVFTFIAWVATGIVSIIWAHRERDYTPMIVWGTIWLHLLFIQYFVAISEREEWGGRVTRTIPKSFLMRGIAFLFYSGSAGSMLFTLLLTGGTLLTFALHLNPSGPRWRESRDFQELLYVFLFTCLYTFCFTGTAVLIRNAFLPRRVKGAQTVMVAFLLIVIVSALPYILAYLFMGSRAAFGRRVTPWWLLPNAMFTIPQASSLSSYRIFDMRPLAFWFTGVWSALTFAGLLPSMIRQWKRFRRTKDELAEAAATVELAEEVKPISAAALEHPEGIQGEQSDDRFAT